jgi:glycosyltransferase involved in cell wall biosynthesis
MGPNRIMFLSGSWGYGGSERSLEILAVELARRSRVLVMTGNDKHRRNLRLAGSRAGVRLSVWRLPFHEDRLATALAVVTYMAARLLWRPQVVIGNTGRAAAVLSRAARFWPWMGLKVWLYVRDFQASELPANLANLPAARVLVPGLTVLDRPDYLASLVEPATDRPVRLVPDMVGAVHEGEPSSNGGVLHLATVNLWKGHEHLIRAVARLRQTGRHLRVRSCGFNDSARLRSELERQIAAAGIGGPDGFELLPAVEDPTTELRGCRCVVVTSVSRNGGPETFGRTIIEAWAHGRPVVAFAAGGPLHLITHEVDGLLVPEGDESALAEALWRVQTEPGLARRLGAAGREKVSEHYLVGPVVDQLMKVLSEFED